MLRNKINKTIKIEIEKNSSSFRLELEGEYVELQDSKRGLKLIAGSFIQKHDMIDLTAKYFLINDVDKKIRIHIGSCRLDSNHQFEIAIFEASGNFK